MGNEVHLLIIIINITGIYKYTHVNEPVTQSVDQIGHSTPHKSGEVKILEYSRNFSCRKVFSSY